MSRYLNEFFLIWEEQQIFYFIVIELFLLFFLFLNIVEYLLRHNLKEPKIIVLSGAIEVGKTILGNTLKYELMKKGKKVKLFV